MTIPMKLLRTKKSNLAMDVTIQVDFYLPSGHWSMLKWWRSVHLAVYFNHSSCFPSRKGAIYPLSEVYSHDEFRCLKDSINFYHPIIYNIVISKCTIILLYNFLFIFSLNFSLIFVIFSFFLIINFYCYYWYVMLLLIQAHGVCRPAWLVSIKKINKY